MQHEKHGQVWHPLRPCGRRPHGELDWSRSELTVSDWVLELTSDFHGGTHYHHGHKRGMADVFGSSPPCFFAVLRFLFTSISRISRPVHISAGFEAEPLVLTLIHTATSSIHTFRHEICVWATFLSGRQLLTCKCLLCINIAYGLPLMPCKRG